MNGLFLFSSGKAISQGVNFLSVIVLARVVSPEAFGLLGYLVSIIAPLSILLSLSLHIAMITKSNEADLGELLSYGFLMSLISAIVIIFSIAVLRVFFDTDTIEEYTTILNVCLFGLPLFLFSLFTQSFLLKKRDYSYLTFLFITVALIQFVSKYLLSNVVGDNSLMIGHVFGLFLGVLFSLYRIKRHGTQLGLIFSFFVNKLVNLKEFFHLNIDFIKYRTPQNFLNSLTQSWMILFVGILFGVEVAGVFVVAKSLSSAPLVLLGKAFGDYTLSEMSNVDESKVGTRKRIKNLYTQILALISVLIFLIVVIFIEDLLQILPKEYANADRFIIPLTLMYLLSLIARPSVSCITLYAKQKILLDFELYSLIFKLIFSILVYSIYPSDTVVIWTFCIISACSYVYLLYFGDISRLQNYGNPGKARAL